jgi:hypothetical protein
MPLDTQYCIIINSKYEIEVVVDKKTSLHYQANPIIQHATQEIL